MKRIAALILFVVVGNVVLAQSTTSPDPTYSAGNYKHPNKAKYAKDNNLDKSSKFETAEVSVSENYKAPYRKSKESKASVAVASKDSPVRTSYKNPYGI